MAASMTQVTAPTSPTTILLGTVPPGATMILSTTSASADVFLGTNNAVTSSTGAPLDATGPTTLTNPASGTTFSVYGCAGTGTHVVGVITITTA